MRYQFSSTKRANQEFLSDPSNGASESQDPLPAQQGSEEHLCGKEVDEKSISGFTLLPKATKEGCGQSEVPDGVWALGEDGL